MLKLFLNNKIKSNIFKNLFYSLSNKTSVYFLRKNRTFVKSRFSRTRQWTKTIVYFAIWFNICSIYLSFIFCYNYIFIYSSFFWLISLGVLSLSFIYFLQSR